MLRRGLGTSFCLTKFHFWFLRQVFKFFFLFWYWVVPLSIKLKTKLLQVPQQRNGEECGCYVLQYISLFIENAPENFSISDGYPYFVSLSAICGLVSQITSASVDLHLILCFQCSMSSYWWIVPLVMHHRWKKTGSLLKDWITSAKH